MVINGEVWTAEITKVLITEKLNGGEAVLWNVYEQLGDEINGNVVHTATEDCVPWSRVDLFVKRHGRSRRVYMYGVLWGWSAENLDNLEELIATTVTWENWITEDELSHHTTSRPDVDGSRVVRATQNKLRSTIKARADVGDVRLVLDEDLGTAEVTDLQLKLGWIDQKIVRFDISVTNT